MLEVGKVYDDLLCIKFLHKNTSNHKVYLMRCIKCGREKESKDYVIKRHTGTSHKACGKGIKTLDKKFYMHWKAMRTRTTNPSYWASDRYLGRGINSDEFELFIDFYDKMYSSYKDALDKYGENISLERKDNDLSYTSDNCIWIPVNEQQGNTSKQKKFKATSPDGTVYIAKNVSKFCEEHHLIRGYVSAELNNDSSRTWYSDWSFEYLVD